MRYQLNTNIQHYTLFQQVPHRSLTLLCSKLDELEEKRSTRPSSHNSHYVATKTNSINFHPQLTVYHSLPGSNFTSHNTINTLSTQRM